jgi:hypothetical protein
MLFEDGLPVDPRKMPGADRAGTVATPDRAGATDAGHAVAVASRRGSVTLSRRTLN